ncbi:replicative DNA helicase [Streptomyces sp. MCA2]|uniref:DnaB-like helicase N-terminal domain-containing protein n=1 Tax=Streptomyces sp. MCA2 TaxID=2944805 RepID=UPI0020214160|nr:DnaB-like helicase N-terminal domain-containing protein [Streptomyces sp. MCA2]MCL7493827.1 replicative DNA helicase [Streptomyces sp. MCA2]
MPHPADPYEGDDLDNLPPPQPVHYAEQALLGALLLEPHRLSTISRLTPDHFGNHAHSTLFHAMRTVPTPSPKQHAKDTAWLSAVLAKAQPEAPGLTASYLHTLIQSCPRPQHAAAYASMIRADHTRRTLREHADRLCQIATDTTLPDSVVAVLAQADALGRYLDELAPQFTPHPSSLPRTPAPPPPPPEAGEEALDEERLLLATATAHPNEVTTMRWLQPDDFTHPLHAGLWQCLVALTRRNTPVDPVTVLWEAQHRGLLSAGPEPSELLDLLASPLGSAECWGERILQRSVLGTAHHIGRRIEAFTEDPATTPYQLVVGSRRALADLSAIRTRWQHATSPAPKSRPARTRGTAAPRASPPRTTAPPTARISL